MKARMFGLYLAFSAVAVWPTFAAPVDLSGGVIVVDSSQKTLAKAAAMIQEDVQRRAGISLAISDGVSRNTPAIVLAVSEDLSLDNAEGYEVRMESSGGNPRVHLTGKSPRGALFAAGYLLRKATIDKGLFRVDSTLNVATAPVYPVRGHQLGYRNTANAYDAWDVREYEQYIRDLVLFGTNAIELIPSLEPGEKNSVHMELSQWDMTVALSQLLDDYDLDVWLWLALGEDVTDSNVSMQELESRRKLFAACTRIDEIFVPGGDPGDTEPDVLMPWLAQMADVLHEMHPDAGVWVSNQGFTPDQNDAFFGYIHRERPKWLAGVVFGPWAKITIKEMRDRTPAEYPIRRYPDITHNVRCQYPVPEWAPAFAHTLGREACNPRPVAQRHIHNVFAPLAVGFATYSDGINDDANKMLWSALGWNPEADLDEVMSDYGRAFFGAKWAEAVAKGLLGLEKNWQGPILENESIDTTFDTWQGIERGMADAVDTNWRAQMYLLRAYYDVYVKARRAEALNAETRAMAVLGGADVSNLSDAIAEAKSILQPQPLPAETTALREKIEAFGEQLFKTIGMQLDVKRYRAQNPERGAVLEFLDQPLNNAKWIDAELARLEEVVRVDGAEKALHAAAALIHWEQPVAGALYDDLGHVGKQPHLVRQHTWTEDPGAVESPQEEFMKEGEQPARLSWLDQAQTLFGTPLRLHYEGLDTTRPYRLRVTYAGRFGATMTLHADGAHEIHGPLKQPSPIAPQEFDIPKAATDDGALDLEWNLVDGRGCQVAEVWLLPGD